MSGQTRYPAEVRERAVHLVFEHEREYDCQSGVPQLICPIVCQTVPLRRQKACWCANTACIYA